MKNLKFILLFLFLLLPGFGIPHAEVVQTGETSSCISCHLELEDELLAPATHFEGDIHHLKGISCHDCHGGNPDSEEADLSMDPDNGFVGVPDALEVPAFCGKCHSSASYMAKFNPSLPIDQENKYRSSKHGMLNSEGNRVVAQCVSCHSAHNIRPAGDPHSSTHALNVPGMCNSCHGDPDLMKAFDLPTDQYRKYSQSAHGISLLEEKDTGAPACNDCHGNHGAVPPGVSSVAYVCGNCHVNNMQLFENSPMREAFTEMHLPGCEICHGYHDIPKPSDSMVGNGTSSTCLGCHSEEKRPGGYREAVAIKELLSSLSGSMERADSIVAEAARRGMDVMDAEFKLKDGRQALIEARTAIHSFSADKVKEKVDIGLDAAQDGQRLGEKVLASYFFRRKWLGFSSLILSFLAVMLFLKIREIDKKKIH
jgi:hypothetical protein